MFPPRRPGMDLSFGGQLPSMAPSNQFDYKAALADWMGNNEYDISNPDMAGQSAQRWGQRWGVPVQGDTAYLPGNQEMDIIGNFGGGMGNAQRLSRNWTPMSGGGGGMLPSLGPSSFNPAFSGMRTGMSPSMGQMQPQGAQPIRRQLGGGKTQSFGQAVGYTGQQQPQRQPRY